MKKILSVLLVLVVAFSLVACSGDSKADGSETETTEGNKEEKTVVTVWTGDRHDLEYVNAKIEEYNSTNTDGIEIDYQVDWRLCKHDYYGSKFKPVQTTIVSASLAGFD